MSISDIRRLTVALERDQDNSPSLARAKLVALANPTRIDFVYCCYSSLLEHNPLLDEKHRTDARQAYLNDQSLWLTGMLSEFKKTLHNDQIQINARVLYNANLTAGLLEDLQQSRADLLIKTAARHRPIQELFFQQQDWQLIRQCPIPLWVPNSAAPNGHILACIDPMHSADPQHTRDLNIIRTAKRLSEISGSAVNILHCFSPLPHGLLFDSDPMESRDTLPHLREQHQQAITALLEGLPIAPEQACLVEGRPEQVIRQQAKNLGCSIIVMGVTSRSVLDSATIGNTAERLLHNIDVDIVLCPALAEN